MKRRILGMVLAGLVTVVGVVGVAGRASADDVEQRIADFWRRIDGLQPSDYVSAADLGQWALNVTARDSRARLTVADFRTSTAIMQSAIERAGPAAAVSATPRPPTPTPAATPFHFGSGQRNVGTDLNPGTYRTRQAVAGCYWERLSGFGGTLGEILANENSNDPTIVAVAATDKGFNSTRCAEWTADLSAITKAPGDPFPDGTYFVGVDVASGTWHNSGGTSCYWQRMSGFSGSFTEIIANANVSTPVNVTIGPDDRGFKSVRCGTWTKVG